MCLSARPEPFSYRSWLTIARKWYQPRHGTTRDVIQPLKWQNHALSLSKPCRRHRRHCCCLPADMIRSAPRRLRNGENVLYLMVGFRTFNRRRWDMQIFQIPRQVIIVSTYLIGNPSVSDCDARTRPGSIRSLGAGLCAFYHVGRCWIPFVVELVKSL